MSKDAQGDVELGILLNLAFGGFKNGLHEWMESQGFDDLGSSFGYVFRSLEDGPLSLAELADRLGMTSQGALKIVSSMVERRYVERRADADDGRVKLLVLTSRGRSAVRSARLYHRKVERELVRQLGGAKVRSARAVLAVLAHGGESRGSHPRPF